MGAGIPGRAVGAGRGCARRVLLGRPATVDGQDGAGDEGIFQQREHGLGGFGHGTDAADGMDAGKPVALGIIGFGLADETVEHRGLDGTKGDGVDAHPLLGDFERGRAGQAIYGVLGRDVNPKAGHADLAGHGGGVDDGPAVRQERGDFILHAQEHAENINVKGLAVIVLGLLFGGEAGCAFNAGIVEGVVQAAIGFDGKIHEGFDVGFLAGIGLKERGGTAGGLDGFDDRLAFGGAAAGDNDPGVAGGEVVGDLGADAAGGTGDESDFVVEGIRHMF